MFSARGVIRRALATAKPGSKGKKKVAVKKDQVRSLDKSQENQLRMFKQILTVNVADIAAVARPGKAEVQALRDEFSTIHKHRMGLAREQATRESRELRVKFEALDALAALDAGLHASAKRRDVRPFPANRPVWTETPKVKGHFERLMGGDE